MDSEKAHRAWGLRVSEDGRRLCRADGRPWFWLGDTAWGLFSRLGRDDVERYLANRRAKGFTVIQAVAVMGYNQPIDMPNVYGHAPFIDGDPARPAVTAGEGEDFWTHVDFVIDAARRYGLYIGLLPIWGYYIGGNQGCSIVFDAAKAESYADWIARRYADRPNIIWINGGDVAGDENGETDIAIWRLFGRTIKNADPHHLMTFHPAGKNSSARLFHEEDWLDFNMVQSGHSARGLAGDDLIRAGWAKAPAKPILNGEPCYEDHPVRWNPHNGFFGPADVRLAAYRSLMAGAFGHTYGHVNVWRFNVPGLVRGEDCFEMQDLYWADVIDRPGASQMTYVRELMLSRPAVGRAPAPAIFADTAKAGEGALQAIRGDWYAMVYSPLGRPVEAAMDQLGWKDCVCWWYDPRTAHAFEAATSGGGVFQPPGEPMVGNDWVLVIDDAAAEYPPPGRVSV